VERKEDVEVVVVSAEVKSLAVEVVVEDRVHTGAEARGWFEF
jgi:hypothetical protein